MLGQVTKACCRVLVIQSKRRERRKSLRNVESWAGTLKEETRDTVHSELDLEVVNTSEIKTLPGIS